MQDLNRIKPQIRSFVLGLAQQKGISKVSEDESLTQSGVVDSLAVFRLVSFVEDSFGIRVADAEISNDNFESIEGIEQFVLSKLKGTGYGAQ